LNRILNLISKHSLRDSNHSTDWYVLRLRLGLPFVYDIMYICMPMFLFTSINQA